MTTLEKLGLTAVIIVAFILGSKLGSYVLDLEAKNERLYTELIGQRESYRQISENLAQLETKYTKQQELAKAAEQRFRGLIRDKDERIKVLSDATYLIGRHVSKQDGPDYYFETKKRTRNYVLNELRIQGSDSPAIGYILIKNDGRTYKRNYKFEIQVENLQTVDEESGRIRVYSKAYLVQKEKSPLVKRVEGYKDWEDVKYPLKITGGTALIDPTIKNQLAPKFHWWAPNLNANINFSGTVEPGLGASLMGYGVSKNDLKYKLLDLGLKYDPVEESFAPTLIPISWRPFDSVLSNTYIGAGVGYENPGLSYFLTLQIGL